jgi:hypothetical protein
MVLIRQEIGRRGRDFRLRRRAVPFDRSRSKASVALATSEGCGAWPEGRLPEILLRSRDAPRDRPIPVDHA